LGIANVYLKLLYSSHSSLTSYHAATSLYSQAGMLPPLSSDWMHGMHSLN